MMQAKEFGKLTPEQFSKLVRRLPDIRHQMDELPALLREDESRWKELLNGQSCSWGYIYEFPFLTQMALLFVQIGLHVPLHAAAASDDPQEAVLNWADDGGVLDHWYKQNEADIEWVHLLWLGVVLQRNILSIMLYHRSMGSLVECVREGDDEALFKAVRVDRTVLLAPTCADRFSKAEIQGDKEFFRRLHSAIKGPSKKHMAVMQDLRYSIVALRTMGFDRFTDKDLETLFIRTRLYPNSAGALKNLRKQIHLARKLQPPETAFSGGGQEPS